MWDWVGKDRKLNVRGTSMSVGSRLSAWSGKVNTIVSPGTREKGDEVETVPMPVVSRRVGEVSRRRSRSRVAWPLLTRVAVG